MSENTAASKMTSSVTDGVLVLERIFDAPRELVFKVFKEPEHLARWWGPTGWTLPVCTVDFRPGGVWHYCMLSPDGKMESWGKGEYLEIVEPERIVYIDSFSDADGNVIESMPQAEITMTFIDLDGKTKLVSSAKYATAEILKTIIDMGVLDGIGQTWDRLEALLADLQR